MVEKGKYEMEARKEKAFVKGLSLADFSIDGNPSVVDVVCSQRKWDSSGR